MYIRNKQITDTDFFKAINEFIDSRDNCERLIYEQFSPNRLEKTLKSSVPIQYKITFVKREINELKIDMEIMKRKVEYLNTQYTKYVNNILKREKLFFKIIDTLYHYKNKFEILSESVLHLR